VPHPRGVRRGGSLPLSHQRIEHFWLLQVYEEARIRNHHSLRAGIPGSRVVLLPNTSHYIFQSNETDVLREINHLISSMP